MRKIRLEAWRAAAAKSAPGGDVAALNWNTPEGITVKPLYTAADLEGLPYTDTLPGFEPFVRGPQATMYAVRPWTIRQYAGFSTAEESNAFYKRGARRRRPGHLGRLRPGHPPRLRLRPSARHRRRRQGRRGDRFGRGHEDPLRRHPARQGLGVDDHERRGAAGAGRLHRRGRGAGRRRRSKLSGTIQNDILKEFMVRNTYIYPPEPSMRIVGRHHRVHGAAHAEVQLDLDLRLPHAGGRRDAGAGAGVHAGRRQGVREDGAGQGAGRGRVRRPAQLLLRHRHELLPRGGQAARGAAAVVADHEGVRRQEARSR